MKAEDREQCLIFLVLGFHVRSQGVCSVTNTCFHILSADLKPVKKTRVFVLF